MGRGLALRYVQFGPRSSRHAAFLPPPPPPPPPLPALAVAATAAAPVVAAAAVAAAPPVAPDNNNSPEGVAVVDNDVSPTRTDDGNLSVGTLSGNTSSDESDDSAAQDSAGTPTEAGAQTNSNLTRRNLAALAETAAAVSSAQRSSQGGSTNTTTRIAPLSSSLRSKESLADAISRGLEDLAMDFTALGQVAGREDDSPVDERADGEEQSRTPEDADVHAHAGEPQFAAPCFVHHAGRGLLRSAAMRTSSKPNGAAPAAAGHACSDPTCVMMHRTVALAARSASETLRS
jgi:hypothetical protein